MHIFTFLGLALGLYSLINLGSAVAATGANLISRSSTASQPQTSAQAAGLTLNLGCIGLTISSWTNVFYPNSDVYEYENQNFWSLTEVLAPSCVFRPTSAKEIGDAIKVLERTNTKFAVRGGGHMGITVCSPVAKSIVWVDIWVLQLLTMWAILGRVQTISTMAC